MDPNKIEKQKSNMSYVDPALCALVECSNGFAKQQCPIKCATTSINKGDTITIRVCHFSYFWEYHVYYF